jgi:hypothetical protein
MVVSLIINLIAALCILVFRLAFGHVDTLLSILDGLVIGSSATGLWLSRHD